MYNIILPIIFKHFIQLDDIRMIKLFQDRSFFLETHLFFFTHLIFLQYFYCSYYLSISMLALLYFTKCSIPQCLTLCIYVTESDSLICWNKITLAYCYCIVIGCHLLVRFFWTRTFRWISTFAAYIPHIQIFKIQILSNF